MSPSLFRAIGLEALYQMYARMALQKGVIIPRLKFLDLPIPMVVNAEILLDNWHHVKGLVSTGRVGFPH